MSVEATNKDREISSTDALVLLYKQTTTSNRDYFLGGKSPTAAAFLPTIPVLTNYLEKASVKGGLTAQEAQFVLAISSLTDQEAKALAGLLIRSFGGLAGGGGKFSFAGVHVSLGDNQMLAQLVEDLFSSFSYHAAQHDLTKAFWKYHPYLDANGKPDPSDPIQIILNNYSSLVSKIKSL